MEFQIGELSEIKYKNRNKYIIETHTHTHTHTHTPTHTHTHGQQRRLPAAEGIKKRICHINMFKNLKVYLSFVE